MSLISKYAAAAAVAAVVTATPASAIIIGGIDFGVFGGLGLHIETATIARSFVNAAGQTTTSYGVISTVNGDSTYCADGTANCALYFRTDATVSGAFGGGSDLYLSGTRVTLFYSGAAAINLLGQSSAANLGFLAGLTQWATFGGENGIDPTAAGLASDTHLLQTLAGASITAAGSALISVDTSDGLGLAVAEAFLDASTIPTFIGSFADIAITESGNNLVLNPFDIVSGAADSCTTAAPQVGDYCLQGSADLRGGTRGTQLIPVPGTLALLGLGLAGIAGVARRSTKK